jgi:glycosyltransferase involved in cell wall biosynthesis/ADP-heptose:LPS heptosyltransferase
MSRIAIVIPWFGRILKGGAERHAWQLAARLASRGHDVEAVTTCCRAHTHDWGVNHLREGVEREPEGFAIRRFPVGPRDGKTFDEANGRLLSLARSTLRPGVPPVDAENERVFCEELIKSPSLVEYIARNRDSFDAIVLLPYLYGPVLEGVHAAGSRALFQPCLHDEAYAYLPTVARAMYAAKRLLFLSEGERRLAERLYGPGIIAKSILVGAGVDLDAKADDALPDAIESRFVLCLGKKDPGKKTDFLVRCFARHRARHPASELQLVLAGPGSLSFPASTPGVIDLGEVTDTQKGALLDRCAALFHPSENESYSRVMMEAWLHGRPVAVNANCLATATAVAEGGGWLAGTEQEWTALFATVDRSSDEALASLGEQGRRYASELASWDGVIGRYEAAIEDIRATRTTPAPRQPIHQVLPNVAAGDAISNHALWIRDKLREWGHPSDIFATAIDKRLASQARAFAEDAFDPADAVIYHHSIGSALTPQVQVHPGPRCLVYHNITPPHYLEPYLPLHTRLCREGREQLPLLAPFFPVSVGDSNYNAVDLAANGFRDPGVLPICVDPVKWQIVPDATLMARLQDGRTNVLFVGRIIPNKKHEDLIYAFSRMRALDPHIRLLLVGGAVTTDDFYLACLERLCSELGVADAVEFSGHVSETELAAYYRTAHLFLCMSEHEGFCIPLVESMWFDLPVLAYAASAVPETLDGAGELFTDKKDVETLARRALQLARDTKAREEVLARQRIRRTAFLDAPVAQRLAALVERMTAAPATSTAQESPAAAIDPDEIRRIAVVKLDHIGDLLLAQPVFASLASRFPNATITAIVAPAAAPILRNDPNVQAIVEYDAPWFWRDVPESSDVARSLSNNTQAMARLGRTAFDLVVNLRSDLANVLVAAAIPHRFLLSYTNDCAYPYVITHPVTRTHAMHICEQHRELIASVGAVDWSPPRLHLTDAMRRRASAMIDVAPGTVAVAPGAGVDFKRWSAAKYRELVRRLRARGVPVALVGTASERAITADVAGDSGALDLAGRFDLMELAAFFERCALLVANDSAPMHIAAAVGTPVVYITRPNTANEFAPVGERHVRCCASMCMRPCEGFNPERREAAVAFCRCIQGISVEEVDERVAALVPVNRSGIARESA